MTTGLPLCILGQDYQIYQRHNLQPWPCFQQDNCKYHRNITISPIYCDHCKYHQDHDHQTCGDGERKESLQQGRHRRALHLYPDFRFHPFVSLKLLLQNQGCLNIWKKEEIVCYSLITSVLFPFLFRRT